MDVVYLHKVIKELDASQIKIHPLKNELRWMEVLYNLTSPFQKGASPLTNASSDENL
jgi:hypothetical protein